MSEQTERSAIQPPPPTEDLRVNSILQMDINQIPETRSKMGDLGRSAARYALNIIQEALRRGELDIDNFRTIVDFGAGSGEPTFILDKIREITGGRVVALERHEPGIERIRALVPSVPIHEGDGLEYLRDQDSTVDLITAFKLGPDNDGELFMKLADASGKALSPNGKLLVYSDIDTIAAVRQRVGSTLNVKIIPEMNKGDTYKFIAETVIVPKNACQELSRPQ